MLGALWLAYAAMNGLTFSLYGLDKRRARQARWRIRERTLLLCTWLMGGVGAYAGMRVFRHKTKHLTFQISTPLAAVLSLALMTAATIRLA